MKSKLIRITTVPVSFENLLGNQLSFMKDFYDVTAISSDVKRLAKFGKNQEVNTYCVELTRKITPIKDIKALIKLYLFLKKEKPLIVHTHTPKAGIIGMLASYLAKVPFRLHTVAGLPLMEVKGIKRIILNFVEKLTYKFATKIYPNSLGLMKFILKSKFTKKTKLKIIANGSSNGIDLSYFNPELYSKNEKLSLRSDLLIEKDDFVFIFVGRIVRDKGINELVGAFEKLSSEINKIKLLLVGPFEDDLDPIRKESKKIIENNKNIISVGYQNDVRPYFSIANVLVFPSYREGFPNVVLQAGAFGLHSIVTNINGCNEIISENKNGWMIPVKDEKAILNSMRNCILKKEILIEEKSNIINLIASRYNQRDVWEGILTEYNFLK